MILDYFADLNWLAVVVATLAWFAFSALWYSIPPLSRAWQGAAKVDPGAGGSPMVTIMLLTVVAYFVTSVVIGLLVAGVGAETLGDGITLGIALGVGFGLSAQLVSQLYEQKGSSYWLINGLNAVISFSIVAGILAVWS